MSLNTFINQMTDVEALVPREIKNRKVAQPTFTRQVVTVVGLKTTAAPFLPVSHEGHSNETYIDKVDVVGKQRAELIARKLKGIERRAHMALFRELAAGVNSGDWRSFFEEHFGDVCAIPDGLCIACWNCALFGGLDAAGQRATFSRVRYFDTYSVEETLECVSMLESEEGMGIGNQVYALACSICCNGRTRGNWRPSLPAERRGSMREARRFPKVPGTSEVPGTRRR